MASDAAKVHDLCASVRAAIVEPLVEKTLRAARRLGVHCVTSSGGVTANLALRRGLEEACRREGILLRLAAPAFCTDNAAMIGILAERKFLSGRAVPSMDVEVNPGWALSDV
jgi:N6-L-threonylcarbamoyladenine synthase